MKTKLLALVLALGILLCGCGDLIAAPIPQPGEAPSGSTLMVHYIDVGQADCILLELEDEFILIDGGNKADSQLVVSYLEQQGVTELEAVVCTHAHEDHVGGLPAVLAVYPTKAVYAPTNTYSSKIFDSFMKYVDQQGLEVIIPAPGDELTLGEMELMVVGPVKSYAETNDTSIVLLGEYGDTRFLFTGDMEVAAENDMMDYWDTQVDWNVDVLKVGHHGSSTSSGYRFVYEADPEYAIVSVGTDNTYGHPHEEILSRYADAEIPLFRTDELGHVIVTSDGSQIQVTWEKQSSQPQQVDKAESIRPTDPAQSGKPLTPGYAYIGNVNTKKLHTPDCPKLPDLENQVYFSTEKEALAQGYDPHKECMG